MPQFINFFICSLIGRYLGCFWFGAIEIKGIRRFLCMCFCEYMFTFQLGVKLGVDLLKYRVCICLP